ncbi:hypothetical protein ABZ783_07275 [Micromonospora sp. NPDC047738]
MVDQPVDAMEKVLGELPMPWVVIDELRAHGELLVRVPDGGC